MMQLSRLPAMLAVTLAALALSSAASAAGLTGTYTATIRSPAELKGRWALVLATGGAYTVKVNGQTVARGRYTSTATTITFSRERGSACTGVGTYAWKRTGKTVSFARKREAPSCGGRAIVLGHRFTQVR